MEKSNKENPQPSNSAPTEIKQRTEEGQKEWEEKMEQIEKQISSSRKNAQDKIKELFGAQWGKEWQRMTEDFYIILDEYPNQESLKHNAFYHALFGSLVVNDNNNIKQYKENITDLKDFPDEYSVEKFLQNLNQRLDEKIAKKEQEANAQKS